MSDGDMSTSVPPDSGSGKILKRLRLPGNYTRLLLLSIGPFIVLVGGLFFYLHGGRYVATDNAYLKSKILSVSTDVSGIVMQINVRDNQRVSAGDELFRLDDEPFRLKAAAAQARMDTIRIEIEAMRALYQQKLNAIEVVKQDLDFYMRDYERKKALVKTQVVADRDVDDAFRAMQTARKKMAELQEDAHGTLINMGGSESLPIEQHPLYMESRAIYDQAIRDMKHTIVKAPMNGILANVENLQLGAYLPAATPAFSLIGSDVLWVEANPKETDMTYVRAGQAASVTVDAYPGRVWTARVETISPATGAQFSVLPAQNATGNWVMVVQRVPVRLQFAEGQDLATLRSGMSVEVEIDTQHRRSFLGLIGLAAE